jgi:drug/metabolite transporter (DMT)-like permease
MGALKVAAMVVTLGGLALVVADRGSAMDEGKPRRFALGVMLALGGALGQAVGFVFSKFGMEGDFSPVSANLIRVCAGTFTLGIWQVVRGSLISNFQRLQDGRAALYIVVGAILGPVVGVVLSLFAITHARYLGVASTLMSLSPVILLPVGILFFKERVTLRAILGTVVTLAGAAALFF